MAAITIRVPKLLSRLDINEIPLQRLASYYDNEGYKLGVTHHWNLRYPIYTDGLQYSTWQSLHKSLLWDFTPTLCVGMT